MTEPTPPGAPARADDPAPPKRTPWRKYDFDDDMLEDLRRRYEETDEPALRIARSRGMSDTHFNRMAKERGWVRFRPGRIGLSPAAKLANRADALLRAGAEEGPPPLTREQLRTMAESILRSAETHAADLETLRRQTTAAGLRARDATLITANIADMAATLGKLTQFCAPEPQRTSADDDKPRDIDEVREALARRIEALVAEWLAEEAGDGGAGDDGDAGE